MYIFILSRCKKTKHKRREKIALKRYVFEKCLQPLLATWAFRGDGWLWRKVKIDVDNIATIDNLFLFKKKIALTLDALGVNLKEPSRVTLINSGHAPSTCKSWHFCYNMWKMWKMATMNVVGRWFVGHRFWSNLPYIAPKCIPTNFGIFIPSFMSRAFELTISNIYFHRLLACRSQLLNKSVGTRISSFKQILRRSNVHKIEFIKLRKLAKILFSLNSDDMVYVELGSKYTYMCRLENIHVSLYSLIWDFFGILR